MNTLKLLLQFLADAIKLIPDGMKQQLKSECGGLQTLLRNNHSIFEVKRGQVCIRKPVNLANRLKQVKLGNNNKQFTFKSRPCWFKARHPDGCPFTSDECSFLHNLDI